MVLPSAQSFAHSAIVYGLFFGPRLASQEHLFESWLLCLGSASRLQDMRSGGRQNTMENAPQNTVSDQKLTIAEINALAKTGEKNILKNCDLQELDLSRSQMPGWHFEKCNLSRTSFNGANLEGSVFAGCRAAGAHFLSAMLTEALFEGGDYSNSSFRGATMAATKISGCKMIGADLTETRTISLELENSLFGFALLPNQSFRKMTLKRIDFGDADLRSCDFRETVFEECSLRDANLSDCRFEHADLRGADLGGVKLGDAKRFKGAVISKRQASDLLGQLGLQVQ